MRAVLELVKALASSDVPQRSAPRAVVLAVLEGELGAGRRVRHVAMTFDGACQREHA